MQISPFLRNKKITLYWSKIFYHQKSENYGDDMFPFICTGLFREISVAAPISSHRQSFEKCHFTLIFIGKSPFISQYPK